MIIASWFTVLAVTGSILQSGAPTRAAKGITISDFLSKGKIISELSVKKCKELIKENVVHGGMIPKINTCIKTVQDGAEAAVIMDGRKKHSLLVELFTEDGVGTLIKD